MDLRNAITPRRLATLRPLPLVADFGFADVPSGSVSLGVLPPGHIVRETVVEILDPFNGGTAITVGDAAAQARFQAVSDNSPERANHYNVNNVFEGYATETEIFVYFPAGSPTSGSGKVTVFVD